MDAFLANPAVQAALAPFVAALVAAALLLRTRFAALAICAALAVAAALSIGFSLESLTAARKLVLCGLASGIVVLLAGVLPAGAGRPARVAAAALAGAGAIWVLLRVLQQWQPLQAWLGGAATAAFIAVLAYEAMRTDDPVQAAAGSLWLGLGGGVLALLGASAALASVGIAVGAGAGAVLLLQMLTGRVAPNWALGLPVAVTAGLAAIVSAFTGELRWYALLPLLAVPWAARALALRSWPVWLRAFLSACVALVPALAAVALAWFRTLPST